MLLTLIPSLKRLTSPLFYFLLLTIGASCQAESIEKNSVILAVEDSWPPYADSNGEGIATDIVRQALAVMGIKLFLKVSPYARVLDEVEKGIVVGGYNVTRQASTQEKFLFGEQALLTASASFYFPAGNKQVAQYQNIADIPNGFSVGIIIDYEYGNDFEQHKHRFKHVYVSSQKQLINMLKLGRIDSAIMFDEVASYTLQSMNLNKTTIQKGPLNHTSDIYVAFSSAHTDALFFAEKLDAGLLHIKQNGDYDKAFSNKDFLAK